MRVIVRSLAQKFEGTEYLGIGKSRCTMKERSFQAEDQGYLNSSERGYDIWL